jgi:hypothetical protein
VKFVREAVIAKSQQTELVYLRLHPVANCIHFRQLINKIWVWNIDKIILKGESHRTRKWNSSCVSHKFHLDWCGIQRREKLEIKCVINGYKIATVAGENNECWEGVPLVNKLRWQEKIMNAMKAPHLLWQCNGRVKKNAMKELSSGHL